MGRGGSGRRTGAVVDEWRTSSGLGLGATSQALVATATSLGFSVAALEQGRFRMARSRRPRWAIVGAVITTPLVGLGLLLLLVKRTTSLDAVVTEHRKGVDVMLTGHVDSTFRTVLEGRLVALGQATKGSLDPLAGVSPDRVEPSTTPPVSRRPLPSADAPDRGDMTWSPPDLASPVHTSTEETQIRPRAVSQPTVRPALAFPDGRRLDLDEVVVIGRNPSDDGSFGRVTVVPVAEPSMSKTHAVIGSSGSVVWVVDRHSTNGTSVVTEAESRACPPGVRVEVPAGALIVLGDFAVKVTAA